MVEEDPYYQLKPCPATPAEDLCCCSTGRILLVRGGVSDNPIACAKCNREVRPEDVGFAQPLAQDLAFWLSFHDCFYHLWLDSGEFEVWAGDQLKDPKSTVNQRGLEVTAKLSEVSPALYWWFQDVGDEVVEPRTQCPVCGESLSPVGWAKGCAECKVFVAD